MTTDEILRLVEEASAADRKEREATQMTLGKLIAALEAMPSGAVVANLGNKHSYRGYYSDLAFERLAGTRPAADLLADCRAAMGEVFEGYKGGEYVMHTRTPLWIADYGRLGLKLIELLAGGEIETAEDPL